MAFSEDLDEFLNVTTGFAVACTYNAATVNLIFDNEFTEELGGLSSKPVAQGKASDFASASPGETITISGTDYNIRELHPDGTGWIVIMLEQA